MFDLQGSLAAAILCKVDAGEIALSDTLKFKADDVLPNSPVTSIPSPALSIGVLLAAAVERSDNTAANLLLGKLGGPPAFRRAAVDGTEGATVGCRRTDADDPVGAETQ